MNQVLRASQVQHIQYYTRLLVKPEGVSNVSSTKPVQWTLVGWEAPEGVKPSQPQPIEHWTYLNSRIHACQIMEAMVSIVFIDNDFIYKFSPIILFLWSFLKQI